MNESIAEPLTLDRFRTLTVDDIVAIRGWAMLEPAGGAGDKVFPPTHSVPDRARTKYAIEKRRIGTDIIDCVLLDSVQSQANRMEEALESLWRARQIRLPVIRVDLSEVAPDVREITSLSAPHRIADALLRDSMLDGTFFRMSDIGRSFTDATMTNAGSLFKVCPTALVFGLWDSTGPKGGLGSKFARALVSEIVGVGCQTGEKTGSRIDRTNIVKDAANIYVAKEAGPDGNPTWTPHVLEAKPRDAKKPPKDDKDTDVVEKWGKKEKAGKPASINLGNIPPTIDEIAGGVTIDYARQTVVLSLAALRKLYFGGDDDVARIALVALALLGVVASQARGYDLRSRCLLVPVVGKALSFEVVRSNGTTEPFALDLPAAIALYNDAVAQLPERLRFESEPGVPLATLTPSPKLEYLIQKSRELFAASADIEEG